MTPDTRHPTPEIELAPESFTVPLSALRFGHEADPPINARQEDREEDVEALAASIAAHGLRMPLDVARKAEGLFVRDGNRRLAALRLLASRGAIAADRAVRCTTSDGDDLELSLVANIERCPLHPIDQYEAFADAASKGRTDKEIAARFGLEVKHVRRMLALGQLSPKIRAAWREGELGHDAEGAAAAFTLARTHADQDRILKKLTKQRRLHTHYIREELGSVSRGEIATLLKFVGRKAYKAAGGGIVEDLFGGDHAIEHPEIVARLAGEKLAAEAKRLTDKEGWAWAAPAKELPNGAAWSWRTIRPEDQATDEERAKLAALNAEAAKCEDADDVDRLDEIDGKISAIEEAIEARGYTAEAKAKAGCILSVGYGGKLEIRYGVLKPGASKPDAGGKGDGKKKPDSPALSAALVTDLAARATRAAAAAAKADGRVALAALLAGFACNNEWSAPRPVRVTTEGLERNAADFRESWAKVFERYATMSVDELLAVAAGVLGRALDMRHGATPPLAEKGNAALLSALPAGAINPAMAEAFDADDYFRRAPKAFAIAALVDIDGRNSCISPKKADIAALAAEKARKAAWLPKELRTGHYAGPGAKRRRSPVERSPEAIAKKKKAKDA